MRTNQKQRTELLPASPTEHHEVVSICLNDTERIEYQKAAERSGLSHRLRSLCRTLVRLPMTGRADSLNVGVAAGVMLYELVRRSRQTT